MEAAFLIPVVLVLLALLLEPAILLYDRMVMEAAAGQGVRMLATRPSKYLDEGIEAAIESQLDAIPDAEIFHAGDWQIELDGNENSDEVTVRIATEVRPLPLVPVVGAMVDDAGMVTVDVEASSPTQPEWAWKRGGGPASWVSQW